MDNELATDMAKRKTYEVLVNGEVNRVAHAGNSAIRASEAAMRETARAERDIYEGDDPVSDWDWRLPVPAEGLVRYTRTWQARRTGFLAKVEIRELAK